MKAQRTSIIVPYLLLATIFFMVGFMTVVNGQCEGPLKVAFLSKTGDLTNTFATMISFFFFLGYLINGPLAGKWLNLIGYKTTLLRGLLFMGAGLSTYLVSSVTAEFNETFFLTLGEAKIPYGFFIFLTGAFLMGTSAALLQTVVIPYASAYDLPSTQPVQRVNIVCAANSFGTTVAPFFVTGVMFGGFSVEEIHAGQLKVSLSVIIMFIILIWFIMKKMPLPDIGGIRDMERNNTRRYILSFRNFRWGVIAIFFYVGAEVAVGTNINLHAMEIGTTEKHMPTLLATLYWGGMMLGRIISGLFNSISARCQLIIATIGALSLLLFAIIFDNLWALAAVGLFQSVMWGCIFTLAVDGLGKYTSQAAGIFMGGVFGGAVIPILQGLLADISGSWRWTWIIIMICEVVILHFAIYGSQIKGNQNKHKIFYRKI